MWDGRVDSMNDFFTYEIQPVDFRRLRKFKEIEALRGIQQNMNIQNWLLIVCIII